MRYGTKTLIIGLVAVLLGFFVYPTAYNRVADLVKLPHFFNVPPFRLGLDLLGGTHLVYQADLTNIAAGQSTGDAMNGVRDVIERRVNFFGVAEPLVQVEGTDRIVVELAGVKDVGQAIQLIGETPFLQFKTERPVAESQAILEAQKKNQRLTEDPYFVDSALTGKYLTRAQVTFASGAAAIGGAQVSLELNSDGAEIFKTLTEQNLNKRIAIYLDGSPISAPTVQSVIPDGNAVITGNFTLQEAKDLATRLNAGALPVPISLISQETIGASLGQQSLFNSLRAGLYGLLLVALFMIFFYRLPGLMSVLALLVYTAIVLAAYKLIPVTLTLAGIAGFILSVGMAVDANILIFERMREELRAGKTYSSAVKAGFARAWFSIRDSNISSLITCAILFYFGTGTVKGFALTLAVGILVSMFTAITITRTFLTLFVGKRISSKKWLIGAGVK